MCASPYLYFAQGDNFSFTTQANVNGVQPNLTGADVSFWAVANPYLDGPTQLINVSTGTGQITLAGTNNANVTVSLNSAFSNNVPIANVGAWFLRAETVGGVVYTLDRGRIAIGPGLPTLPI